MNKNTIYQDLKQKLMGLAIYINDDISDIDLKDICRVVTIVVNKKITEARIDELQNFTVDMDYPIFKKAGERIKELNNADETINN